MKRLSLTTSAIALSFVVAACTAPEKSEDAATAMPETLAEITEAPDHSEEIAAAYAFMERAEAELAAQSHIAAQAYWNQATNITPETNAAAAEAGAASTKLAVSLANESKQFDVSVLPTELARKFNMLRTGITIPAPSTAGAAEELSQITTRLDATYSTGRYKLKENTDSVLKLLGDLSEAERDDIVEKGLTLDQLSTLIENNRDPEVLKEVWEGWRTISPPMKGDYARMVDIANEGANELGFESLDQMWLSGYDMPPADMEAEVERLWSQVEPLYEELHCYTRAKLNDEYGDDVQPRTGPIRADLLGNMWAQQWSSIYDIVEPENTGEIPYDLTKRLNERGYDAIKMVETGEAFFTSLGLDPLPETFWERSMIVRPEGKEVVCHASAWNLDDEEDVRIKMCTEVNSEDFYTVHHELGHNFYQRAYKHQDYLYKTGAHDGFHEAIGDFVALSITPEYLEQIGLISEDEKPGADADTALLMQTALDKIAFLPFAITVDGWRWGVLSGETAPDAYNTAWWDLRLKNQGLVPPAPRPADAFDPGAKYHIPGNTPYLRYFLSFVMQFQFHKAACDQAGWEGPLHRCSIYDNKEVGERFNAMMEAGASQPWPDTLEEFTGTREMDGSAIIEYFDPLMLYLKDENATESCGW
ncbi:MAG TPA: peptidyl-dipeptidase [Hyphomonas atlantica]|uniref:Peptidyl-dipeptidase n=1 Tax=Hyphomonas atlantica TaxID=1280948 RepID=A0A356W3Q6_9PROT|nr:peptidyl-dipeptidase [Hyphomonas atlantica]HBQ48274.1 peptidyl-dipeptidase [Hyphomonas atlantica]